MQRQGMWSAGDGDDNRRFLADLRALRDAAALEFDELAARAHYPTDVLKEAESGPALPGLPILAAYVRACDGDVPEWEERWRHLSLEAEADPGLPVRPVGASPAAVAGARAGVSVAPPEAYDADRIRAVLRSSVGTPAANSDRRGRGRGRGWAATERDGHGTAAAIQPRVPESPASWNTGTNWDETAGWDTSRPAAGWDNAADAPTVTGPRRDAAGDERTDAGARWDAASVDLGNGNHRVSESGDGLADTGIVETPDAVQAEAIRRDPFSAAWLQDGELTSPPDLEPGWRETGPSAAEPTSVEPSSVAEPTWFTPRDRTDNGLTPSERPLGPPPAIDDSEPVLGFWTPSAAASAEVRRPDPAQAETPATDAPGAPSILPQGPTDTPALAMSGPAVPPTPAVPPGPVVPPSESRSDRLYPVRLLVVIVVAALIGSIVVLLLH